MGLVGDSATTKFSFGGAGLAGGAAAAAGLMDGWIDGLVGLGAGGVAGGDFGIGERTSGCRSQYWRALFKREEYG